MTSKSLLSINLLSPVLFYKNPVDIYQIQNGSTQMNGPSCVIDSCRGFNQNLASNEPASQYQRQKLIQNTVRVHSSLYTMNLAGLSGYQKPLNTPQLIEHTGTQYIAPAKVYWNQMSDRARPSNQVTKVASGTTYHTSSTRHSITRERPGSMSPGGVGVDIKHNSYNRYLNKIKGKGPLRRGVIPPTYGASIPFNRAYPIYGGKIIKTAIINNCDCTDTSEKNKLIYESSLQEKNLSVNYTYNIGDFVWVKKYKTDTLLSKGEIIDISDGSYTVKIIDSDVIMKLSYCELSIYFDCNCEPSLSLKERALSSFPNERQISVSLFSDNNIYCNILNTIGSEGYIYLE
jgi:hypothetical protein